MKNEDFIMKCYYGRLLNVQSTGLDILKWSGGMYMSHKDIYIMGRAEYLSEYKGCLLTEGCNIAEKEWEETHK